MDSILTGLNGLMILGVSGWAVYLWYHGAASVGIVAARWRCRCGCIR